MGGGRGNEGREGREWEERKGVLRESRNEGWESREWEGRKGVREKRSWSGEREVIMGVVRDGGREWKVAGNGGREWRPRAGVEGGSRE